MACGGCQKRRAARTAVKRDKEDYDLMGGYANLTDRQIKARLEVYKRRYCQKCTKRYECDYKNYLECRKSAKIK
jgi:hypothetical protein